MNTYYLLNTIFTGILLFLTGLWVKSFLPSYFNEKGKLLAQKEDIKEVTEKIESIKTEFTKETERLKIELQRISSLQLSHRNEERNCIVSFYEKYNQWLYSILEINYGSYSRGNIKELSEKRIFLDKFYSEANVAQAKVKLLVKDEEIERVSHQLLSLLLKFKHWADYRLLLLQQNLETHQSLSERFLIIIKDYEANKQLAKSMADDEQDLKRKNEELVKFFHENKNEEFKKILPTDVLFTSLVKSYLLK